MSRTPAGVPQPGLRAPTLAGQELEDLPRILDETALTALLEAAGLRVTRAACDYVRLKPEAGALVGVTVAGTDGSGRPVSARGYVRTHARERARELARKWTARPAVPGPFGPGVVPLPGGRSVLFLFPNDTHLRDLRLVTDMDKLKRILRELPFIGGAGLRVRGRRSRMETVRYKPERRYVARASLALHDDSRAAGGGREVFLRFFPDTRGSAIAALVAALRTDLGRLVPEPLGSVMEGRMYVEEAVPGGPFLDELRAGRADAGAVAALLARLHGAAARPRLLPRVDQAARSRRAVATLGIVDAGLARRAAEVLDSVQDRLDPPAGDLVHGDCHVHQLLSVRGSPVLVDFERTGLGHGLEDLGQLVAHLRALQRREPSNRSAFEEFEEALLRSYALRRRLERERLRAFLAAALVERALLPLRRLDPDWRERSHELLDLAGPAAGGPHVVSRSRTFFSLDDADPKLPAFDVFYPHRSGVFGGWVHGAGGCRLYGVYDSRRDLFEPVDPRRDPKLPALPGWLDRGRLVSYRPGRRATIAVRDGPRARYVKVVRPSRAEALVGILGALPRKGPPFPLLPALEDADPERGVLVFPQLAGEPLSDVLLRRGGPDDASLELLVRSLSAFQGEPVEGTGLRQRGPDWDPDVWIGWLRQHDPDLASRAETARAMIERSSSASGAGEACLLHGDLHDGNILLQAGRIALLDLDLAHLGDPAEDLGNLAAHLVLRALQRGDGEARGRSDAARLVEAYVRAGGRAPGDAVSLAMSRCLLRLVTVYRFRRRWAALAGQLMAACHSLCEATSRLEEGGGPAVLE